MTHSTRIAERFASLRRQRRAGLVTYFTAGDPDLARSGDILRALDRAGADLIEVGVPFSDPVADGPAIERAAGRALAAGGSARATLDLIGQARADVGAPIVLFTYLNPVLRFGLDAFARRAAEAGVDGVLVLDLPLEEAAPLREAIADAGLDMIFLVSPTTSEDRMARAAALGSGFLYAISRLGVTGARTSIAGSARAVVERVRHHSTLPVALGFGISTPGQVAEAGRFADAVVVGSAIVAVIEGARGDGDVGGAVEAFVRPLAAALAGSRREGVGRAS
ncbi:MAG TPA: tryptophan synthase subunit alpha [Vicinamibacterales bacterium]|nr:tryptophan synthase subunit alpha [Vicinamibacterales bacterium]